MNLNLEEESYETVISELQEKIAFESLLTEPNTGVITLYRSQIEHYQKLEKKRLQKVALRAKCASVFTPLKEDATQMKNTIKNEQFELGSRVETFVQNAPDLIQGKAARVFSDEVVLLRNNVVEASGMCESIT